MKEDLYKVLGVDKKSDKRDIKKAYRNKAKIYHPDHKGNSDDFFKINRAYSVLIDDKKRRLYDETGQINSNTEDKAKNIAYDRLGQLFLEIVTKKKDLICELDVIGLLKNIIFNHIEKCKGNINETKQIKKHFKKIKKRIRYKGKGINIFDAIIEDKVRNCSLMINQSEFELKIFAEMKKILNDFEFDYDKIERSYHKASRYTPTSNIFSWDM